MLELINVRKNFGGLQAVHNLSFTVNAGEIVSLIGPNGAGKTTVMNMITGIYAPTAGDIRLNGASIGGLSPDEITRRGLARTFQSLRLFLNMSVIENVMAAAYPRTSAALWQIILRTPAFRREEARIRQMAEEKLAFFGARLQGYRHDQPAYSLSYANRRRLEIARAMATEPKLLLLDEPLAGTGHEEGARVVETLKRLKGRYTIVLVEHDMDAVFALADRITVLVYGRVIASGDPAAIRSNEEVKRAYLGDQHVVVAHG
jgi:ABC-type branched-subunit amino acid transport system ATPase component